MPITLGDECGSGVLCQKESTRGTQSKNAGIAFIACCDLFRSELVEILLGVPSPSVSAQLADKGACVLCKRLAAPSDVELKKNMIIMKLQIIYTQKSSRVAFVKGKMLIPTIAYYHFNIKNNHLVMFNFIWWHFCWKVELFFLSSAERN